MAKTFSTANYLCSQCNNPFHGITPCVIVPSDTTLIEALENAVTFLESLGYASGDVHDDLAVAASYVRIKLPAISKARIY